MGHTYSLGTIRVIGFFLAKLLRNLYQGVAINNSAVLKVKKLIFYFLNEIQYFFLSQLSKAMSEGPVLILPTHRSYANIISLLYYGYPSSCYCRGNGYTYSSFSFGYDVYNFMFVSDFKGMKFVNRVLQNAGTM
jgi:hypothetical protein